MMHLGPSPANGTMTVLECVLFQASLALQRQLYKSMQPATGPSQALERFGAVEIAVIWTTRLVA